MRELTQEQHMVASVFAEHFGAGRKRPLVLYGLGRNTEAILRLHPEIGLAGVMGPDAGGPVWRGKPVLSGEEAAALGADIVIVARDSVVPLIYRRIAPLETHGVRVFRIDGTRLEDGARSWHGESLPYWKLTREEVERRIDGAGYVSFDIFDTLLGRRLLRPEELYKAVERSFPKRTCPEGMFAKTRREAEHTLGPTAGIEAIYRLVQENMKLTSPAAAELMELEWKLERENVFLRRDMGELFRYAEEKEKHITLLSDMFWPSERLRCLLASQGLRTGAPILVSCELGYSKEDGRLYAAYLERTGARPEDCLHVGDNRYADIEAARRAGLSTCQVFSGYQMLEASAAQALLDRGTADGDADTVGKWISRQCSSPFALHKKTGRFFVETPYELGYGYLGPLVDFWLGWLQDQLRGGGLRRMLFPARDGYLLQKLYELLRTNTPELPPSVYFKASRRAVTAASLRTEADVYDAAARGFHGSARDFFRRRFGVEINDETPWEFESERARELLAHAMPAVLERAAEERDCYLNYLESLGLPGEGTSGFFDFAAGGTVQRYYELLTGRGTEGFYFATSNLPNRFYKPEDISAPFGNITSYGCSSPLAKHYVMLENVLTDPDTMLVRVGADGEFVFADGRNAAWPVMEQVQRGIFDYVSERLRRGEPPAGREAALGIFKLLFDGSAVVPPRLRKWFVYEDTYDGAAPEPCWTEPLS